MTYKKAYEREINKNKELEYKKCEYMKRKDEIDKIIQMRDKGYEFEDIAKILGLVPSNVNKDYYNYRELNTTIKI